MLMEDPWTNLRELTAARIALGRCGHSLPTRELLAFQLAHARARDAVHHGLDAQLLTRKKTTRLKSAARDRGIYLRRPDLGRRLDPESAKQLSRGEWDLLIAVVDGLSAIAVNRHAGPLLDGLAPLLDGLQIAPICIVEHGRVAIGDEIGERVGAALALVLVGERPGLSSPDSLGAYLTWAPRVGRTDAERNCVSNIRIGGLEPSLAAHRIAALIQVARERRLTGVELNTSNLLSVRSVPQSALPQIAEIDHADPLIAEPKI
jgi:ethanolamine ammonia-lyase small subunit